MRAENETGAREHETTHPKPYWGHSEYDTIRMKHSMARRDTA